MQDSTDDSNPGFEKRQTAAAASQTMRFYFKILHDLGTQPRLILPGVAVQIILTNSNDAFRIMSGEAAKNQILKIMSINQATCQNSFPEYPTTPGDS